MTRFARAGRRKFVEASTWDDLSANKPSAKPLPKVDEASSTNKKTKIHSKIMKGLAQNKSGTTVLDPKKQKQIEARRLRRKKLKCCFVCRRRGHKAFECPNKDDIEIGSCFKCGSSDHTTKKCKANIQDDNSTGAFPFAKCFICQEMGHLARSCPENPRGLYPQGGGCKVCGSVEHLRRDCPELLEKKIEGSTTDSVTLVQTEGALHNSADAEPVLETENPKHKKKHGKRKEKVVNF